MDFAVKSFFSEKSRTLSQQLKAYSVGSREESVRSAGGRCGRHGV
jgi:hypothetical protein